jgi:heptosyltransferase-2
LTRRTCAFAAAQSKNFIIFRLDALGDLVLTTPLFRELKHNFPAAHLTVVAQQNYRSILITNPYIDEILSVKPTRSKWLPKGLANLLAALGLYWGELRRRRFDVAISPCWDTDEHLATLLCVLTDAGTRVGYSERGSPGKRRYNRGFDQAFDICLEPGPLQHEVLRNLKIVEALGGSTRNTALDIHLAPEDKQYAEQTLADLDEGYVLIGVGIGAQSPGRRWPLERYAACLYELSSEYNILAVITCAPAEHDGAVHLASVLDNRSLISDSAEIRETSALLARCDLFIGNDTGAAHLAAAMQCPTIVISRHPKSGDPEHPNSPARFAPWCSSAQVLQPARGRDQCTTRCLRAEPHCIEQISVAEVVAAAKALLMQSRQSSDKLEASLSL